MAAGHSTIETIHAQPYSGAQGFYFSNLTDYQQRAALLAGRGIEEWELSYCDGEHAELFEAAGVSQANIGEWFELLDTVVEYQEPALFYLLYTCCESMSDALSHLEDVVIHAGDVTSYVEELIEDMGALEGLPEQLRFYFDYAGLARDMQYNGEASELQYNGTTYSVSGY